MGGIGKTTIAKALFSQLFPQYDAVCFLANVREEAKRLGLTSLCDKLLSELLKDEHHKDNPAGSTFILRRLSNKRVLIVLDDMDSLDQVDILFREQCNFVGPDSKVIITTRNRHLLTGRVDKIYEVGIWNFVESLELFCLHAFKERHPNKGYEDLSERAVKYAGGVPLALKVLGSNLHCRSTEFWECELSKLMNCPNDRIQNVLQVSYDELDNLEKKIFLDIAFFFKGEDKDYVVRILDACGFYATSGVKVLEDKALITISYSGTIQMHDLIQEMGLNIVRGGIEDPGKRSRLRDIEEISDVLENKKGSNVIEGIKLDLSEIEDLHLKTNTLNLMTNLRILRLYVPSGKRSGNVHYSGVLNNLSGKLRYLEWNGCFLKSFPVTFCAKMLVEVCMPHLATCVLAGKPEISSPFSTSFELFLLHFLFLEAQILHRGFVKFLNLDKLLASLALSAVLRAGRETTWGLLFDKPAGRKDPLSGADITELLWCSIICAGVLIAVDVSIHIFLYSRDRSVAGSWAVAGIWS
ncbi:TMV resistance protein N [Cajanus cajan]|uniref:TMV resistance protein N n=1 Tax=Cajanus cajan TaxID=3821 RepID=UPI00098D9C01|nr:TMV resistance protein N [Cajanus cajan]